MTKLGFQFIFVVGALVLLCRIHILFKISLSDLVKEEQALQTSLLKNKEELNCLYQRLAELTEEQSELLYSGIALHNTISTSPSVVCLVVFLGLVLLWSLLLAEYSVGKFTSI